MPTLDKITKNNRGMLLAYDHGFEHGPTDFDERSVDPAWIMDIADAGYFTGVIFQKDASLDTYYQTYPCAMPLWDADGMELNNWSGIQ